VKNNIIAHCRFATRRHLVVIVGMPYSLTFFFFVLGFFVVIGVASESPLKWRETFEISMKKME
jgi:hypothetical protein